MQSERRQQRFESVHRLRVAHAPTSPRDAQGVAVLDLVVDAPSAPRPGFAQRALGPPNPKYALPASKRGQRQTTLVLDELPHVKTLAEMRAERALELQRQRESEQEGSDEWEIDYYVMEDTLDTVCLSCSAASMATRSVLPVIRQEEDLELYRSAAIVPVESFHVSMLGTVWPAPCHRPLRSLVWHKVQICSSTNMTAATRKSSTILKKFRVFLSTCVLFLSDYLRVSVTHRRPKRVRTRMGMMTTRSARDYVVRWRWTPGVATMTRTATRIARRSAARARDSSPSGSAARYTRARHPIPLTQCALLLPLSLHSAK